MLLAYVAAYVADSLCSWLEWQAMLVVDVVACVVMVHIVGPCGSFVASLRRGQYCWKPAWQLACSQLLVVTSLNIPHRME